MGYAAIIGGMFIKFGTGTPARTKDKKMKQMPTAGFKCDVNHKPANLPHFWEHTVGSGHATMALRADWQKQLTRCNRELGFRHVRFHGLLSDDMGTLVNEKNSLVYSFFNADQVCDFLLSIGMRPFIELSFMPTALASGSDTVFHYKGNVTAPKDYHDWEIFIKKLVKHWVQRYGVSEVSQWFFEVWNEPNLSAFWKKTQADYFEFYRHTANAIKKVNRNLKVGGPATADNAWITAFIDYCDKNKVPADFISTHHYPTDAFGQPGDDTITQLSKSKRSVLQKEAKKVKKQAQGKPVYYTEWCTSSNPFDELHDMPYAACFIIKTVIEANGIVEGYSYWTFSDIFEENYFSSVPFHGGFGLLTIYGIPKPAYRAYQLLHRLGSELLKVTGKHETVDAWIVRKKDTINILITNWALPRHPIKTEIVKVQIDNIKKIKASFIERIDEDHANAKKIWINMGSPGSLSPGEVSALEVASALIKEPFETRRVKGSALMKVTVPPQGVAFITIELE
jgi:xylan 1,4-beta-xylosidase